MPNPTLSLSIPCATASFVTTSWLWRLMTFHFGTVCRPSRYAARARVRKRIRRHRVPRGFAGEISGAKTTLGSPFWFHSAIPTEEGGGQYVDSPHDESTNADVLMVTVRFAN